MENSWLSMAKRLQAIATTGNTYVQDKFDQERYDEVSAIALQMMADLSQKPVEVMADLFNEGAASYQTPKGEVRAAVFHEDRILLIQEKSDGLWALPGGFADLGLSPAENVEKEVHEEANIEVEATHLYSVRHKSKGAYDPDVIDFYKMFFLCRIKNNHAVSPGLETSGAAYFELDNLPPLSTGRTIAGDLLAAWDFKNNTSQATYFE
ncbi:MAG: ADP-ribose pyrophosphatase YjhB (NUDIX family) [Halioglobus sp.]|jgi:ADP-ribose pyrophosphatase YjhB (NUDIX family)